MYPKDLDRLIQILEKLPTIGNKTAERLVLFIVEKFNEKDIFNLVDVLQNIKKIKKCQICSILSDNDICDICSNTRRDSSKIMVVSDIRDVYQIENSKIYDGKYHILNGLINFNKGIDVDMLNIDSLYKRLDTCMEIILGTPNTVEGELTAQYLKKTINTMSDIKITRLAYGLPSGGDLKYADYYTLQKALENRNKF